MTDAENDDKILQQIVGTELEAVTFVRDYIQLSFDGSKLNAITLPKVTNLLTTQILGWTDVGYKDALCGQIGQYVHKVAVIHAVELLIYFSGSVVSISLKREEYTTAEAVVYSNYSGRVLLVL